MMAYYENCDGLEMTILLIGAPSLPAFVIPDTDENRKPCWKAHPGIESGLTDDEMRTSMSLDCGIYEQVAIG